MGRLSHYQEVDREVKEITFGKEYYHLHSEIEEWCKKHVGPGGQYGGEEIITWKALGKWRLSCTFGNSKISFKNDEDATLFKLTWLL